MQSRCDVGWSMWTRILCFADACPLLPVMAPPLRVRCGQRGPTSLGPFLCFDVLTLIKEGLVSNPARGCRAFDSRRCIAFPRWGPLRGSRWIGRRLCPRGDWEFLSVALWVAGVVVVGHCFFSHRLWCCVGCVLWDWGVLFSSVHFACLICSVSRDLLWCAVVVLCAGRTRLRGVFGFHDCGIRLHVIEWCRYVGLCLGVVAGLQVHHLRWVWVCCWRQCAIYVQEHRWSTLRRSVGWKVAFPIEGAASECSGAFSRVMTGGGGRR